MKIALDKGAENVYNSRAVREGGAAKPAERKKIEKLSKTS